MIRASKGRVEADVDAIVRDLDRTDEVSERVRLASYGLAAPLVGMRERQMEREVARVAARRGERDPEVAARRTALESAKVRFGQFRTEFALTRVQPGPVSETGAGVSGRVVRGPEPVVDATVIAYAAGARVGFTCTGTDGGFSMEVPAGKGITLSVVLRDGGEAFRDREGMDLKPRQRIVRLIDLEGRAAPCAEPGDVKPPADDSFLMVSLLDQLEADARQLIGVQGLVLGERTETVEPDRAGRVVAQDPAARTKVKRGDPVKITVATDNSVETPSVLGMTLDDARLALAKAELTMGEITRSQVEREREGRVLNQSPLAGERVERKSAVKLEVGIAKPGGPRPRIDPQVSRIAELADHRLAERGAPGEAQTTLAERLAAAKITRMADLDKLIDGDREAARTSLGLATLAETDRALSALKAARKELSE